MKKRICVLVAFSLTVISLAGCSGDSNTDSTTDSSYESSSSQSEDSETNSSGSSSSSGSYNSGSSSSYSNSSSKTIEHYCDADGCYKEGTKTMTGFSGETEYYCQEHYDEIQDIISGMEEDVGNGSASTHQCEASGCNKEGTHELTGFSGAAEYYCTEHYSEMMEILEMMLEDYDN